MQNWNHELNIARKGAKAGAKVLKKRFCETSNARCKGDAKGLVTDTDIEAEKAILNILSENTTYGILSEESGSNGIYSGPKWVVDPLDGTNNFARSMPTFAVSIALMLGNEAFVGVIIDPIHNREFYAVKGNGCFLNGEKKVLSTFNKNFTPTLFLNHGYARADRNKFKRLTEKLASTSDILKLGTTALELTYVSEGLVDGFICSGDEVWDFAAGIVIAQETGCLFTDWKGDSWDGKDNHILVARPEVHSKLVEIIQDLQ